jgi:hypothetical protein
VRARNLLHGKQLVARRTRRSMASLPTWERSDPAPRCTAREQERAEQLALGPSWGTQSHPAIMGLRDLADQFRDHVQREL